MLSLYHAQMIAAFAGICGGGILGLFITTRSEVISRQMSSRAVPLSKVSGTPGIVVRILGALVLLASAVVLVSLGILKVGGVDYLDANLKVVFGLCFLVGAGIGKYCRYRYWQRN